MADRAELKGRAKECLKQYYWMALLVSIIASVLGAGQNYSFNFNINTKNTTSTAGMYNGDVDHSAYITMLAIIAVALIIIFLIGILIQTFLSNVVQVGLCSYFLESRKTKTDAGFSRLFYGFGCGSYLNLVKAMFMKSLIVFGWWLLLIIPGIIKEYEYSMVPYLLAEQPEMDYRTALNRSRSLMNGHKWDFFVLQLSFIGWRLLGIMMCCIGVMFVVPYENATYAEFYAELNKNEIEI